MEGLFRRYAVRMSKLFGSGPFLGTVACAGLLLLSPGTPAVAANKKIVMKVAVSFPRSPKMAMRTARYNRDLAEVTDGQVQVRVYWGGVAGDERAVLRKMKTGQLDGSPFGLEMVSNFVREALVLASPGLFLNYKQVDLVRATLTPEFNAEAYRNGFKVMGWGDVGRLRLFSKQRVTDPGSFRKVRPWLYPESEILKEFYRLIGVSGVPLSISEVYSGMQTGMIDTYWATAVIAGALQWHRTAKYVSAEGLGFVSGAFVFRRPAWDALPKAAQESMVQLAEDQARDNQVEIRRDDELAFRKLLKRGYKAVKARPEVTDQWWEIGQKLRKRMIGRIYTQRLVDRAETLALRYADEDQRRRFARLR